MSDVADVPAGYFRPECDKRPNLIEFCMDSRSRLTFPTRMYRQSGLISPFIPTGRSRSQAYRRIYVMARKLLFEMGVQRSDENCCSKVGNDNW
jgi:hypothetical protein